MQTFLNLLPYILTLAVIAGGYLYQQLPAKQKTEIESLAKKYEFVRTLVYDEVHQVEKTMNGEAGMTKKEVVLESINTILADLHIPISAAVLDSMIESIVSELPHILKPGTTQPVQQQQITQLVPPMQIMPDVMQKIPLADKNISGAHPFDGQ